VVSVKPRAETLAKRPAAFTRYLECIHARGHTGDYDRGEQSCAHGTT
jgi:hypothetical protein